MAFLNQSRIALLSLTSIVTGLIFLDNTVLPVALPTIEGELKLSSLSSMWVVNSYLLTMVVLFLIGGRIVDLIGKRRAYLHGLTFFAVGSLLGACSINLMTLLSGRVIQGLGGALISPATGALLIDSFPRNERARAIGINTGISSFFLMIGPLVGGLLTTYLGWRAIFWINLPIILIALFRAVKILPVREKVFGKFHFMGALPLAFSLFLLVFALMEGPYLGWSSPWILLSFSLAPLLFFLFVFFSKKTDHPLFDFSILKERSFFGATLCIFVIQFIVMVTLFFQLFWQGEREYNALEAGLLMMGATFPVLIAAPLGGFLADRFTPRLPLSLGFLLIAFGLMWVYYFSMASPWQLLLGLVALGVGIPMIFSPAFAFAMTAVKKSELASASSMVTTIRQVAATLGLAVMSALFYSTFSATGSYQRAFSSLLLMDFFLAFFGLLLTQVFLRLPRQER